MAETKDKNKELIRQKYKQVDELLRRLPEFETEGFKKTISGILKYMCSMLETLHMELIETREEMAKSDDMDHVMESLQKLSELYSGTEGRPAE